MEHHDSLGHEITALGMPEHHTAPRSPHDSLGSLLIRLLNV